MKFGETLTVTSVGSLLPGPAPPAASAPAQQLAALEPFPHRLHAVLGSRRADGRPAGDVRALYTRPAPTGAPSPAPARRPSRAGRADCAAARGRDAEPADAPDWPPGLEAAVPGSC